MTTTDDSLGVLAGFAVVSISSGGLGVLMGLLMTC